MLATDHKMNNHVMIDLETLSTDSHAVIVTIGAMKFDPYNIIPPTDIFYRRVQLVNSGYHLNMETLMWWMQQKDEARNEAFNMNVRLSIKQSLADLAYWLPVNPYIWAHGKDFDVPILNHAFDYEGLPLPWKFWDTRDTRTVYDMAKINVKDFAIPEGFSEHHAIGDCYRQVAAVQRGYQILGIKQ